MYYVYILELSDLKKRIKYHNYGKVPHTKKFLPVRLVHYSAFGSEEKALDFEKYLKSGSGTSFRSNRLV